MFKPKRQTYHHKPHSHNTPHPSQNGNFHKHTARQHPYEHGYHEHNENSFHGHHHGSHHSHSEQSEGAKRLKDGSLQCLYCPNECIMTVSEDGSVRGNHCPKGAEAAQHIAE